MSTDPAAPALAPVNFKGRTLTPVPNDDGDMVWADDAGMQFVPYGRFSKIVAENRTLKEKGAPAPDIEPIRNQIRGELEAEYAPRLLQYQAEAAILRHGLIGDAETSEEIMDRYSRARPDADGKKPLIGDWLKAQVDAKPRWLTPHLQNPGAPAAPVTPADAPTAPDPAPVAVKASPRSDPNGGVARTGAPPAQTGFTDDQVQRMSPEELARNLSAIRRDMGLPDQFQRPGAKG
jgi:hypothetical protein